MQDWIPTAGMEGGAGAALPLGVRSGARTPGAELRAAGRTQVLPEAVAAVALLQRRR